MAKPTLPVRTAWHRATWHGMAAGPAHAIGMANPPCGAAQHIRAAAHTQAGPRRTAVVESSQKAQGGTHRHKGGPSPTLLSCGIRAQPLPLFSAPALKSPAASRQPLPMCLCLLGFHTSSTSPPAQPLISYGRLIVDFAGERPHRAAASRPRHLRPCLAAQPCKDKQRHSGAAGGTGRSTGSAQQRMEYLCLSMQACIFAGTCTRWSDWRAVRPAPPFPDSHP